MVSLLRHILIIFDNHSIWEYAKKLNQTYLVMSAFITTRLYIKRKHFSLNKNFYLNNIIIKIVCMKLCFWVKK